MTQTITAFTDVPWATDTTGVINPATNHCSGDHLVTASSISTATNREIEARVTNTNPNPFTIKKNTAIAEFKRRLPGEAKKIRPLSTAALKDDTITYVNELLKTTVRPSVNPNQWFPTPDIPGDTNTLTPVQSRIPKDIKELQVIILEVTLDTNNCPEERETYFKRNDSQLNNENKEDIEEISVEFNAITSRHTLDIGINHDFKVKHTPNTEEPTYSQYLPSPINLKQDLTVELALMHYFGIIPNLTFSQYASPIFATRKPNGLKQPDLEWLN